MARRKENFSIQHNGWPAKQVKNFEPEKRMLQEKGFEVRPVYIVESSHGSVLELITACVQNIVVA